MEKEYDVTTIKQYPYLAAYDGEVLGPLSEAPRIETDTKVYDSLIYENGGEEEVSKRIIRHSARITIHTKNIDKALSLVGGLSKGTDLASGENRKALSFTPITENADEKVLTFPSAVLLPDLEYVPTMGGDHVARLIFTAYPGEDGKLFNYA